MTNGVLAGLENADDQRVMAEEIRKTVFYQRHVKHEAVDEKGNQRSENPCANVNLQLALNIHIHSRSCAIRFQPSLMELFLPLPVLSQLLHPALGQLFPVFISSWHATIIPCRILLRLKHL